MYTSAQHDNIEKRFLLEISPWGFSFWDFGYYCLLFVFSWQLYCGSPTTFESSTASELGVTVGLE